MPRQLLYFLMAVLCLVSCSRNKTDIVSYWSFLRAADLKQCPLGHSNLSDLPILYGCLIMDEQGPADLQEEIKDNQIMTGGCGKSSGMPEVYTRCLACEFTYSPFQSGMDKSFERSEESRTGD